MKKTSKSKSKKYPKLKKYALGLTPNDPLTPVTTTNNPAGNINKIDPNIQRNYPVYQKILLEGEPETYWQGSVKSTPDEFLKLNKSGNITSMPSVRQISKTDWEKNIGTSNMMSDYQRYHKYGGVQLPKYAYGDTPDGMAPMTVPEDPTIKPYYAPAESAAITEQKQQQKANQQSQISSQDAVNIGAAAAKGGMNMYTTQNDPNATSMQKGQSTRDAVYGVGTAVGGAINPALGTAMGLVDSGSKMVRASADKTNSEGQLVNKGGSQVAGAAGAFLDPAGALIELQSDPNATDVEKVAGALTGGYSEMFSGRHQRQVESDAKANIEAQAAAKKSYDEQVAAQQAQQQAYMNQQIQSGINNYYANPDQNKNQSQTFAMGGVPQMPNAEVEGNEMITSNTPPQTFGGGGVELASNNPYGTPTYKTNGASHANGGMPINMAPGSIINGKTINPMTGNKFTKDIDAIAKMENKFTKKAESGDKYSKTMANLMLPTLAMKKEKLNELQKYVIANNEERKALKNGMIPSKNNGMSGPQGMPDQSQNEMVMAKHGAQMPIYDEEAVEYKDGGIHIKPENRGKFTAYKERTGKTTAEALQSPNAHVRQMANFARNAAKWKHEMGGEQGLPMYENGITPNWYTPYFPKPEYSGAPGFANPNQTNAPFITKEEQNQLAWEDMNRRGQANESAATGQQPQTAPTTVAQTPSYNNIYPRVSSTPSPFMTPRESDRLQYENDVRKVTEQGMAAKGAGQQPPPDPKDYSNYADYAAAAAQLAGPIAGLISNKKPALQNYVAPQASLMNSTEAMRQANIEANAARKALKDMTGGNVGQQLGNLSSVSARNALAKAQVQERYDNANAQIMNRNAETAADYANKSIDKRDADLANYRNLNTKYIGDIGTSLANVNRDSKQTRYDQDYIDFMEREYPQAYAKYKEDKKKNSKTKK